MAEAEEKAVWWRPRYERSLCSCRVSVKTDRGCYTGEESVIRWLFACRGEETKQRADDKMDNTGVTG